MTGRQVVKDQYPHDDIRFIPHDITARLPFEDNEIDFIYCSEVVEHLISPESIFVEFRRVLKKGGYLGITDFDVKKPMSRPYRHSEGMRSYKMEYWRPFDGSPHYSLVEKTAFSYAGKNFHPDAQERLSSVVLYKEKNR